MVITLETGQKLETTRITLEELGEMVGLPIDVRPWWGSVRRTRAEMKIQIPVSESGMGEPQEVGSRRFVDWSCGAQGRNLKKLPEIKDGKIVLWQGRCCPQHICEQMVDVKDVCSQAMLIVIRIGRNKASAAQFLLGMDGGHPYVVRVTLRSQTIKEALDWLMPKMVREAIEQGLNVKRQGDWFFIPIDKAPNDYYYFNQRVWGSLPELKTNKLYRGARLVYSGTQTRHTAASVIYKTRVGLPCAAPVVKGNVKAPDHPTLRLADWHMAIRNRSHPWRNERLRPDD